MAPTPEQKALARAKKVAQERVSMEQQIKELEAAKLQLGKDLIELLDLAGERKIELAPGSGYDLQRPKTEKWDQERVRNHLSATNSKLIPKVFIQKETFDRGALEKLVAANAIDGADELLRDAVEIVEGTPRLMPLRAVKS